MSGVDAETVARIASVVAAVLLGVLVIFQVALAAGVPWGSAAYGGAHPSLPARLRATSALAAVVWTLVLLVVLRRAGFAVPAPLPDAWLTVAVWVLAGLFVVACVMNAITPSRVERAIWLPVSLVLLAAIVTVAIAGVPPA